MTLRQVEGSPESGSRITPNGSSPAASPILAAPASEQGEREAFEGLSAKLWCDLRTDEERSAWLLLGRGHETGVVAKALQNDLAMAYHRLALLSASLRASPAVPVAQDERCKLGRNTRYLDCPCCRAALSAATPSAVSAEARDAARYRFLLGKAKSHSPHMDGSMGYRFPPMDLRGNGFDAAIDAAMGTPPAGEQK